MQPFNTSSDNSERMISFSWTVAFFPYAAIHGISQRKAHYLLRVPSAVARYARIVKALGPNDWEVEFQLSPRARMKHPKLPQVLKARLIRYQIPGFRPSCLLTSLLDPKDFPASELIDLYHFRWRIETIYSEWKHSLDIQNLRSHTPVGILKEMHAHLLLSNLARWVMTEAAEGTNQRPVEFSFRTTLTLLRNALLRLLRTPTSEIPPIYQELLAQVRKALVRQRPGRSYPRPEDGKVKDKGLGKSRLPARLSSLT